MISILKHIPSVVFLESTLDFPTKPPVLYCFSLIVYIGACGVCVCCVQVQYWPEAENKLSYGKISVSCKTVDTVNDALVTTAFELYRNGSIAVVSKHLLLA